MVGPLDVGTLAQPMLPEWNSNGGSCLCPSESLFGFYHVFPELCIRGTKGLCLLRSLSGLCSWVADRRPSSTPSTRRTPRGRPRSERGTGALGRGLKYTRQAHRIMPSNSMSRLQNVTILRTSLEPKKTWLALKCGACGW